MEKTFCLISQLLCTTDSSKNRSSGKVGGGFRLVCVGFFGQPFGTRYGPSSDPLLRILFRFLSAFSAGMTTSCDKHTAQVLAPEARAISPQAWLPFSSMRPAYPELFIYSNWHLFSLQHIKRVLSLQTSSVNTVHC
jgi:hypothetical protein